MKYTQQLVVWQVILPRHKVKKMFLAAPNGHTGKYSEKLAVLEQDAG